MIFAQKMLCQNVIDMCSNSIWQAPFFYHGLCFDNWFYQFESNSVIGTISCNICFRQYEFLILFCRDFSFLLEKFPKTTLLAQVKQKQLKNEERSIRKKRGWKKKSFACDISSLIWHCMETRQHHRWALTILHLWSLRVQIPN